MRTFPDEPEGRAVARSEDSNPWRVPLLALGGDFMTGEEIGARAKELRIPKGGLYFRGRVSVLGDVTPTTARDVLAIFPAWLIDKTWSSSANLSREAVMQAHVDACHEWGRTRLAGMGECARLGELLVRAVDGTHPAGAVLARAWQQAERPVDAPALAAHAAMVLREMRGALHFAALSLVNLPVTRAALVDDLGGASRLRRTGWSREETTALVADAQEGDAERWAEAESATDAAFLAAVGEALGESGTNELGGLLLGAYEARRGGTGTAH